jgi:plasmid stabilization system protein ParE
MEPAVTYSKRGVADITKALEHIATYARDAQEYTQQVGRILIELNNLAVTPMLGKPVPGIESTKYQYWLILDNRYRVYFERLDPTHIQVGLFRSTKAKPVTAATVKRAFNSPK